MKTLLLSLILLTAQISFAEELTVESLYGKYIGVGGDCEGLRVYIGKIKGASGKEYLEVAYYDSEASLDQFQLESSVRYTQTKTITTSKQSVGDTLVFRENVFLSATEQLLSYTQWSFAILEDGNLYHEKLEKTLSSKPREFKTTCELERK